MLTLLTFLFYFANLEVALLLRYYDDDDEDVDKNASNSEKSQAYPLMSLVNCRPSYTLHPS